MEHAGSPKKRCTDCRRWYEPSPRAVETQRICGGDCRKRRRRRLARKRRWRDVQEARVAERERQRRWRAGKRASKATGCGQGEPAAATCHAPASSAKHLELHEKVRESVDKLVELSRATLYRLVPRILGELARSTAAAGTEGGP